MLELVRWLRSAKPGSAIVPELSRRFDLKQLIDFAAVSAITSDYDSFGKGDVWWYRANLADAKWQPIPWDKDLAFGDPLVTDCGCPIDPNRPFYRGGADAVFSLVLDTPELRARVIERIHDLYRTVFTPEWYARRIGERLPSVKAGIGGARSGRRFATHPQQHMGTQGLWKTHRA